MTQNCWIEQLRRLRSMYGEKAFPDERVRLLAKELSPLTDEQLGGVVDDIIANLNHAPTLKDFVKYAEGLLKKNYDEREKAFEREIEARRNSGKSCWYCDDVGTVSAIDKTNRHASTFAFGCPAPDCIAREFKAKNATRWSESWESRFQPCFMGTGKTVFQEWRLIHESTPDTSHIHDKAWPRLINELAAKKEQFEHDDNEPPEAG